MIDHLSTYATDYSITKKFYVSVLNPLGFFIQHEFKAEWEVDFPTRRICAFGPEGKSVFWIIETKQKYTPRHVAFSASSRSQVEAFYHAGIKNGGADNGKPGLRPKYHDNYFAAFLIDPDGNDIEAVCHTG